MPGIAELHFIKACGYKEYLQEEGMVHLFKIDLTDLPRGRSFFCEFSECI